MVYQKRRSCRRSQSDEYIFSVIEKLPIKTNDILKNDSIQLKQFLLMTWRVVFINDHSTVTPNALDNRFCNGLTVWNLQFTQTRQCLLLLALFIVDATFCLKWGSSGGSLNSGG